MTPGKLFPWRHVRWLLYLLVVGGLLLARDGIRWGDVFPGAGEGEGVLIVSGGDLAPRLLDRALELYRRDEPDLRARIRGGGTNHALEDLINGDASVGLLVRPPTPGEQELFRAVDGDTVLWFPVALGGIALLAGEDRGGPPLDPSDLRGLLTGSSSPRFDRVFVPDPNRGLWYALHAALGLPSPEEAGGGVVFLADEAGILEAVRMEPRGLGVASTLALPDSLAPSLALVPLRGGEDAPAEGVLPTYENIGHGVYPLLHTLYAACRERGDIEGGKFVTYLTSKPGQRGLERGGFVPAYRYLREVVLTTHPVGN
jgi:ABC-type phosphate transport system substrate-binding protein